MDCPAKEELIEERIDRILTQYRESPKLLGLIRHDLGQIADVLIEACGLPSKFDILSSVGHQLTLVGKRLGWPRCHCICLPVPVFGFACGETSVNKPVVGLCEGGVWSNCLEAGTGDICLDDDEVYRGYLMARRFQLLKLWDIDSLSLSASYLWGDSAIVTNLGGGKVAIQPGRALSTAEIMQLPLAFRVLPVAPGIGPHISYQIGKIFGFGTGWGGLCEGATWLCPQPFDPYNCN